MKMEIDAIVQARMDSTRLPGKILLPIQGKPILAHIIERLQRAKRIRHIIIATTEDSMRAVESVTALYPQVKVFCGSKEDVLARYVGAANKYKSEIIVRATGDNPLVSPYYIDLAIEHHLHTASDLTHFIGIPLGTGVEVINTRSLKEASALTQAPYDREHVTPFLYKNNTTFKIAEPLAPKLHYRSDLKVTVDTPEDYKKVSNIFDSCGKNPNISDIIDYFDRLECSPIYRHHAQKAMAL